MSSWCNFHSHTVHSLLDGYGHVDQYAKRAAELGMPALAITDHGNVAGWVDFYDACREHGVKPILGQEFYQARKTRHDKDEEELASGVAADEVGQRGPYHMTVVARNQEGFRNVIKLSSRAFNEGMYGKPRIDFELLDEHSEGLLVASGCLNGGLAQAIMRDDMDAAIAFAAKTQDIVGKDNYFIEVMNHTIEEEKYVLPYLVEVAKKIGAKVIATADSHYVNPEDSFWHDIMLCVSTGATVSDENRFSFVKDEFYLKTRQEMETRHDPEWLDNTLFAADMIEEFELDRGNVYFPSFPVPDGDSEEDMFERLVWRGVKKRFGDNPPKEVLDRVKYEMMVVKHLGFPSYFLVVSDIINWAKDSGIPVGPGRGSAAASMISYVMGITNLDPLKYGLIFERFLLPEAVSYEPTFEEIV